MYKRLDRAGWHKSLHPKYSALVPPSIQQLWCHKQFVPTGQTVKSVFYCDVLRRLLENARRRRPEVWREKIWLLHHDNVPPLTSVLTQQFLEKYSMAVIPHPPYFTELAPCDFILFPKMKLKPKGRQFYTAEEIQAESE
jgi:hypothetical protein